jgi:bis(5'-nucleosidyl)-tetraphosphatase
MKSGVLSAGVVMVRALDGVPHFLLLRVFRYWDFPKGEVEPGEEPLETAVREVAEETGLADLSFPWGYDYIETPRYGHQRKVARYYLASSGHGEVSLPVNLQLGHPEHHEFRWLKYAEARTRLNGRLKAVLDWARRGIELAPLD